MEHDFTLANFTPDVVRLSKEQRMIAEQLIEICAENQSFLEALVFVYVDIVSAKYKDF